MEATVPASIYISGGSLNLTTQNRGRKKWYTRGSLNMIGCIVITDGFPS